MALNVLIAGSPDKNREYPVAAGTLSGVPVLAGGKPAVTLTARGDVVDSKGKALGGIGNKADSATVAFDGVYIFPVTGVTASTPKGTKVYRVTATGALSLTATDATAFGVTYDSKPSASACAVEIGA